MSGDFYVEVAVWCKVTASLLFIVFLVFMWFKFVTPAVVASRDRKNAELAEMEKRRDESKKDAGIARKELENAEDDVRAIEARAQADVRRVRDRILAAANGEGARLLRNAEGELERRRAEARENLRNDLLARALRIARDAGSRLDDAIDRRLVDETVRVADREGSA